MKKLFPFLLAALCLGSFCSCGTNITYKNAEKYSVGGSTVTGVARLEIGWLDGSVTIGTHDGEGVIFSETASRELGDADKLRYWLNGDKLYLQYARAGRVNLKNLNKELTVLLPAGTELLSLEINGVSADIVCGGGGGDFSCRQAEIASISGNLSVRLLSSGGTLELESVSGRITAETVGQFERLKAESTSGDVRMTASALREFEISTVSGDIELVLLSGEPREGQVETVSGAVSLFLPEGIGFTAKYKTVSGSFRCEHSGTLETGRIEVGNGACELKLESVSGDLEIRKTES